MKRGIAVIAAALLLALAACSRVTPENYGKVNTGMARGEVYGILGQPDEVSGGGIGPLTMSAETWKSGKHTIVISFAGDSVALKSIESAP